MNTIPVLSLRGALVVSLPKELLDSEVEDLQRRLLEELRRTRAGGVVVDMTAVDIVDSYMGRVIRDTAAMCSLMGARSVVVGLQPAVAITLVELGLDLPGVHTDLDLERGLSWLMKHM